MRRWRLELELKKQRRGDQRRPYIYTRPRCRGVLPRPGSSARSRDAQLCHCPLSLCAPPVPPADNGISDSFFLLPARHRGPGGACGGCDWPEGLTGCLLGGPPAGLISTDDIVGFPRTFITPTRPAVGRYPTLVARENQAPYRVPRGEGRHETEPTEVPSRTSSRPSVDVATAGADRHGMGWHEHWQAGRRKTCRTYIPCLVIVNRTISGGPRWDGGPRAVTPGTSYTRGGRATQCTLRVRDCMGTPAPCRRVCVAAGKKVR